MIYPKFANSFLFVRRLRKRLWDERSLEFPILIDALFPSSYSELYASLFSLKTWCIISGDFNIINVYFLHRVETRLLRFFMQEIDWFFRK